MKTQNQSFIINSKISLLAAGFYLMNRRKKKLQKVRKCKKNIALTGEDSISLGGIRKN